MVDEILTLQYVSLEVKLWRFTQDNFPRERLNGPELSRSQANTPLRKGRPYEAPYNWQISAICDPDEAETLDAMHGAYQKSPSAVLILDRTRRYWEPGPRTREIVADTTELTKGGQVGYYAHFNAEFQGALTIGKLGNYRRVDFQLVETTKVVVVS